MARDSAIDFSVDQAQKLFGKGIEVIGRRTGIESLYNYGREVVEQQEEDIRQGNYQPEYTMGLREAYTQGGIGKAIGWLGEKTQENLATSAPALVGGLAAALTAPFSVPVAALIGGSTLVGSGIMGTGEVAQEMEDKTGDYNDAVAIGAGTIIGLLDKFGAGKVIPKDELLTMTGKQLIRALGAEGKIDAAREIGKRIGKATAFEAATESAQEGVSVGATALTGGEYTGLEVADKLLEGFVLGGTMGGGMTTGIEAFRQAPGAVNKVQDIFSGGPGTGGFTPQMAFAGASFSPDRAQLQQVPLTTSEILMNQGPSNQGSSPIQKINESTEKNLNATTDEEADPKQNFFNQNMTGESTKDNPTVSPLRIILTNLKKQNEGVRKTGKDIIGDLRASEKGKQGLVGFMGNYDVRTTEVKEKKALPADGVDGKAFGIAMKEARGDYTKLDPSMYKLIDITKPSREEVLSFNDNVTGTSDSVTQNRGGEAYNSGLEEFLVRNKDKQLSYDDVIKAFDQTRPQVKLEIRSKAAGQNPTGRLVNANDPDAGNTITEDNIVAGVALETTQRLMQNFVDEDGNSLSDPRDFEVDSVAIVSHDEGKTTVRSGALENSGTIDSVKEMKSLSGQENIGDERELKIGGGHDYHGKGAAYLRGMVVRRAEDGKLYLTVEEVQDDQSRIKEENIDVATPMYDLDSADQTLEKTWTERLELAKAGTIPRNLETEEIVDDFYEDDDIDPIARDKKIAILNEAKENRRPASLHSFKATVSDRAGNYRDGRTRNIFDASEKQKIITMDEIEQDLPFDDSLTKLKQQREDKQKLVDEKMVTYADVTAKYDTLEDEVKDLETNRILPRQNIDFKENVLDDLLEHETVFTGNINDLVKDRTIASFIGRDPNQNFYDLLEEGSDGESNNVIAPIIEATWDALAKDGQLKSNIEKSRYNDDDNLRVGVVQDQNDPRIIEENRFFSTKPGHQQILSTRATDVLRKAGLKRTFLKTDPIETMLYNFPGRVNRMNPRNSLELSSNRITKEIEGDPTLFSTTTYDKHEYFEAMQKRTSKPEAFRKTIQMLMKEEINLAANNVLEAKITEYILKNHVQFRKSPENKMPDTDLNELIIANYKSEDQINSADLSKTPQENIQRRSVDFEALQNDVIERLGPKAIKDIDNFLDKELDAMALKIGFMPENGGFLASQRVRYPAPVPAPTDENKKIGYKQQALRETDTTTLKSPYMNLFEEPFMQLVKSNNPAHLEKVYKSLDQQKKNIDTLADKLRKDQEELRKFNNRDEKKRRQEAFKKAIEKRAKEFNYSPKELLDAYDRLGKHIDNTRPYKRDSAHSSQAQASRAIIKGAINQIPELGKIYGEPVVGLVFPAKTDLQNMSGRAQLPPNDGSDAYQRALIKHQKAGITSYEIAPNIVKKQFQDALLDEAGNSQVQVEEGVEFNMIGKSGAKAKLKNPVQFVLRLDPNSAGEKLARSKFVFKAKGGTVDLRKAV